MFLGIKLSPGSGALCIDACSRWWLKFPGHLRFLLLGVSIGNLKLYLAAQLMTTVLCWEVQFNDVFDCSKLILVQLPAA